VDVDVVVDGAVDMSATFVVHLDESTMAAWSAAKYLGRAELQRAGDRSTNCRVNDKGGAHVHGAVNDYGTVDDHDYASRAPFGREATPMVDFASAISSSTMFSGISLTVVSKAHCPSASQNTTLAARTVSSPNVLNSSKALHPSQLSLTGRALNLHSRG
jgi:hypothetical protein